jgi:hypothetical protein
MTGGNLYPDDRYGEFFERFVKAASDTVFEGAVVEAAFLARRPSAGEDGVEEGVSVMFVLVCVDRQVFERQVRHIMETIQIVRPPSREQAAAIALLRGNFFTGF